MAKLWTNTNYDLKSNKTVLVKEYSKTLAEGDEPYYPVNTTRNAEILEKYTKLAAKDTKDKNIIFGGRLGEYKYYDMDQVFASALNVFENKIKNIFMV